MNSDFFSRWFYTYQQLLWRFWFHVWRNPSSARQKYSKRKWYYCRSRSHFGRSICRKFCRSKSKLYSYSYWLPECVLMTKNKRFLRTFCLLGDGEMYRIELMIILGSWYAVIISWTHHSAQELNKTIPGVISTYMLLPYSIHLPPFPGNCLICWVLSLLFPCHSCLFVLLHI